MTTVAIVVGVVLRAANLVSQHNKGLPIVVIGTKRWGYYRLDRHDGAYNNMCDYRGDGNTCGGCGNDSNKPGGPLTRDFSLQL